MKYLILTYASQKDYDAMATGAAEFEPMYKFMGEFNAELAASGELVETRGLAAPAHTRRIQGSFVTDGPYAETQEVLAGYWVVECASFDRATEIAGRLNDCPNPGFANPYADVRPIIESHEQLEG